MSLKQLRSPLGDGQAFFNKGSLTNYYLSEPRKTTHYTYKVGIQQLFSREGADDKAKAASIADTVCRELEPFLERLPEFEAAALRELRAVGWPDDLPVEGMQFVLFAGYGIPREFGRQPTEPARISFYAGGHLEFAISSKGDVSPVFDKRYLEQVLADYAKQARLSALPELQHKIFGRIERDVLAPLKKKKLGRRFVAFNLYLPDDHVEDFSPEMLDDFVHIRENMGDLLPELVAALAPLRDDWVENWLDPSNREVAKSFDAAFPTARAKGTVSQDEFLSALWLSSICISPFGNGSAQKDPIATWDFHALPREADNTIFVVRTDCSGRIVDVCEES